jgi:Tfp pilus assembly protein PilE
MDMLKKKKMIKNSAGITLIELLIAVALSAIVGLTILSAFSAGLKAYHKAQNMSGPRTDVLITFEKMERDFKNAFGWEGIGFKGNDTNVSFPTLVYKTEQEEDDQGETVESEQLVLGGISYVMDWSKKTLIRKEAVYPFDWNDSGIKDEPLAEIEAIKINYYYRDPETQIYNWISSWTQPGLPVAVRVTITFQGVEGSEEITRIIMLSV